MRWSKTSGSLGGLSQYPYLVPSTQKKHYRPRKTISERDGPNVFVSVRTKGFPGTGYQVLTSGY